MTTSTRIGSIMTATAARQGTIISNSTSQHNILTNVPAFATKVLSTNHNSGSGVCKGMEIGEWYTKNNNNINRQKN